MALNGRISKKTFLFSKSQSWWGGIFFATILVITLQLFAKINQQWLLSWSWSSSSTQGWGGPPQGEDEVLRLQTSPWRQGVGGEDLYLVKHGVDDHVDVDSDDHMMMLAIEAFAKFSVGVRLVWQKSQQWFSLSSFDLQYVLQLQDWSAKVFERLTKVLLTVFECLRNNIPRSI